MKSEVSGSGSKIKMLWILCTVKTKQKCTAKDSFNFCVSTPFLVNFLSIYSTFLFRKRSTELTVGPGCDLEERANILVTEVRLIDMHKA